VSAPAELLAHRAPMLLLDEIVGLDESSVTARVRIGSQSPFFDGSGVPSYVGLEYMAQACGAFVGALAVAAGRAPRIGYLLGTRNFVARIGRFASGDELDVVATCVYRDEEMGAFDCRIRRGEAVLAEAQLNVYQPREPRDG
jgi:predicted hotdog family 3-hydroxylacyl-ACP dehydratase